MMYQKLLSPLSTKPLYPLLQYAIYAVLCFIIAAIFTGFSMVTLVFFGHTAMPPIMIGLLYTVILAMPWVRHNASVPWLVSLPYFFPIVISLATSEHWPTFAQVLAENIPFFILLYMAYWKAYTPKLPLISYKIKVLRFFSVWIFQSAIGITAVIYYFHAFRLVIKGNVLKADRLEFFDVDG